MSQATLSGGYHNSNLFSNYYLDERVYDLDAWDCDEEAAAVFEELQDLYDLERGLVEGYGEDALIDNWIDEVLEILGFGTQVETTLPEGDGFVDALLFENPDKRRKAAQVYLDTNDTIDLFERGFGIVEAKQWDADFSRRFSEQRPYHNASQQIKRYLGKTPDSIQWGILTNGRKWRLYGTKDYEEQTYYEVDLPELLERGDLETFKYFYVFFRPEAFREVGGETFLDEVWSESETTAQELGEDLQDNVFTALRVLGRGFVETNDLEISPDDEAALDELKEQSLVLLYRLMFVLYAESRGLIHPEGGQAETEYEENFSLDALRLEIHGEIGEVDEGFDSTFSEYSTSYWSRLQDLFRLIDEGEESLGIPPYNGGLFDQGKHSFLSENEVSNRYLAEVIYRLSTTQNEEERYVLADYADLDTRHLGSVYEGLLEHQFQIAPEEYAAVAEDAGQVWKPATEVTVADAVETVPKGGLYVVNDNGERKATGAYYTPDYVVTYIVEETVEPLVDEIRDDLVDQGFEPGTQEYLGPFLRRVTDLKILDPAMGSGHFLTRATGFLAEQVMDEVREVETELGVAFDEQHVRREIAKECIYGVDINGMAVELAKLSMWLETLAADRPLAFLDHHLKAGNSLVGSDVTEVLTDDNGDDGQLTLTQALARVRQDTLEHVMELMEDLLAIDNETLEDVHSMEEIYDEIRADPLYQSLFELTNVHTAEQFGLDVPTNAYEEMAGVIEDDAKWAEIQETDWFQSAQATAVEESFFHWELEFPGIFFSKDGERLVEAGFDAVIGNPPYAPIQRLQKRHTNYYKKSFDVAQGNYDLYVLFVKKGVDILDTGGKFGYIIPNKLFQVDYGEELRGYLATDNIVSEIVDFGSNQVFPESATTYTSILLLDDGDYNKDITYWNLEDHSNPASLNWKENSTEWVMNSFQHETLSSDSWDFHRQEIQSLIAGIEETSVPLGELTASIGRGSSTGSDEIYEVHLEEEDDDIVYCTSDATNEEIQIEKQALRKPIHSTDFSKYLFEGIESKRLIWPYNSDYELLSEEEFSSQYPHAWAYLNTNRDVLEDRADYAHWYDYSAPRNLKIHDQAEILIPLLADSPSFAPYPKPQSDYVLMASGGFGISLKRNSNYSPKYILSLINSKLLFICLKSISNVFRGGYITCTKQYFRELPIRDIEFKIDEQEREDAVDNLKEDIIEKLSNAGTSNINKQIQRHIQGGRNEIVHDILVYLADEVSTQRNKKHNLNLSLFDYLGQYTEEKQLDEIGFVQPASGSGDTIVSQTTKAFPNLRIGNVQIHRNSSTSVEIKLTARYKPDDEDTHETDQWGYTETESLPALQITELTETEADLIEHFVPVAVDTAGGFANFRETATKTKSLIDRLRELTLPALEEVRKGLESYIETKERAAELDENIEQTDELIDEIVYELYGLTDEEIEIVEEAVGN